MTRDDAMPVPALLDQPITPEEREWWQRHGRKIMVRRKWPMMMGIQVGPFVAAYVLTVLVRGEPLLAHLGRTVATTIVTIVITTLLLYFMNSSAEREKAILERRLQQHLDTPDA